MRSVSKHESILISNLSERQIHGSRRFSKRETQLSAIEPTLLEKRLCEAFDVFDSSKLGEIDVRDLGTIIRALGCVITEAELQEIQVVVEDVENSSVPTDKFVEYMHKAINERKYKPAEPEDLLRAFQLLDPENRGYIMRDVLEKAMMEIGEPFSEQEIADMMVIACDPKTKRINYEHYINLLIVKIPNERNVYSIVDEMDAARLKAMPKKRRLEDLLLNYQTA
ncbi:PREDICTED: EF-hand calcium-binding domain-containing protein 2-like [Dufourea novaeangliae]|uniref:EF-hand calcium-binding domain-containing protein 2-like n=1 Tax=Dufourea novaeangliae TaxID=178035 RepID=UPI000767363D|nr:PREDICTED: EF-hand calcium-binding domain-containing protein 2-like [Dufourea novaeangliae]